MIGSCVTISLVPEARGGPFVFWDDLEAGCRQAAELGFHAIEIFVRDPQATDPRQIASLLQQYELRLGAMGTGAGWVLHHLTLTHAESAHRARAQAFVRSVIDLAGQFGAPAIIGSMQGRWGGEVSKPVALGFLAESLTALAEHAATHGTMLLYEPLNRYETNLINSLADGAAFLDTLRVKNVKLLADLFHMNIEEQDIAAALRAAPGHVGHLHFVDSNRRPAGCGHLDYTPIAKALHEIGYNGLASAEALPFPDSRAAAEQTMNAYRRYLQAPLSA
jgi:sugar phosphate isomerase/epimerase